ncbi:MAG: hypothetical protein AAFN08_01015 [Cyanobacteria bacterium J06559_3]
MAETQDLQTELMQAIATRLESLDGGIRTVNASLLTIAVNGQTTNQKLTENTDQLARLTESMQESERVARAEFAELRRLIREQSQVAQRQAENIQQLIALGDQLTSRSA